MAVLLPRPGRAGSMCALSIAQRARWTLRRLQRVAPIKGRSNILSLEQHKCGDPRCKVPHDGGFTRGLKDIKARMHKDGEDFWIGVNKDRTIKLKLVLVQD